MDVSVPTIRDVQTDEEYGLWLESLKVRYAHAKTRALVKVNAENLLWKWQLGRELVLRKAEERWGTGVVEQLSFDLQSAFPQEKGFGSRNLWHMKQWYLFYAEKLQRSVAEIPLCNFPDSIKLQRSVAEIHDTLAGEGLEFPPFFAFIGWRHHIAIVSACSDINEAFYYLKKTIEENLSKDSLSNCIKADLYHTRGRAVTNFSERLPLLQAELAQEITKESYDFGFVSLPDGYRESQLEEALTQQMTRFLLELGKGFAFVGRQKEIVVSGRSRYIDLLFYHIYLRCYVVVELKAVAFQPEFAGKLNYYVAAVDEAIKKESDNPTIGLLICSDMDKTDVQLAFKGVTTPLGVASYANVQLKEVVEQLPTIEQLTARIRLLELQLKKEK